MNPPPAMGGRGLVAGAVTAATEWLVEPLEVVPKPARRTRDRPVVAVVGLGPRSGATTVARALATELAIRDASGACAVTARAGSVLCLGTAAAGRLARSLASAGHSRTCGRLCLIDPPDRLALAGTAPGLAPLVFDEGDPRDAAVVAALADRVVLVGGPRVEPALAGVVAASLARVGPRPLVVACRPAEDSGWTGRVDMAIPHSRLGAQWAIAGRQPAGDFGRAVVALADLMERWE